MNARIAACAALMSLLVGCSGGGTTKPASPDAGTSTKPTFSNVWGTVILGNACQSSQCHGASATGGLQLTSKAMAYTSLVGVDAAGVCTDGGTSPACACGQSGEKRVVAGDPASSLLIQKLSGNPPCGTRMPQTGDLITPDQLDLVTNWVAAGAKND